MAGISARGVTVSFGGRVAVKSADIEAGPGEWVALVGPNGSGKTSLLHALAGVVACEGTIELAGVSRRAMSRSAAARMVALVPQHPALPGGMSALSYVLLGRTPHLGYWEMERAADLRISLEALERLDAGGLADRALASLSGGERQRVVLARALAQEASVFLLDEPTTGLDIGHQQQVLDLVEGLRRSRGIAVVSALHDLTLASQYADRLVFLDEGAVVAQGAASAVLTAGRLALFSGARVTLLTGPDGELMVIPRRGGPGATGRAI
jgi:iron complex transport system ATP-binding protein